MIYIYILITQLLLFISNLPLIMRVGLAWGKKIFPLVNIDWPHDYFLYLSTIKQGMSGVLLTHNMFTVEKIPPDFIYFIYNLVGFISIPFHLPAFIVFHLFRLLTLELFFFSVYLLTKYLFGKRWILPALLVLILPLTPFSLLRPFLGEPLLSAGFVWWVYFEALERLNNLPHYLLAQSFLVLAIYFLFKFQSEERFKHWFLSLLLFGTSAFILPSLSIIILMAIPLSLFLTGKMFIRYIPLIIFVFTILAFFKLQTSALRWDLYQGWLFDRWNRGETGFYNIALLIFAYPAMVSILSFLFIFKKRYKQFLLFPLWLTIPFFLAPFANILRFPKIHLLSSNLFIPLAILTGLLIAETLGKAKYRAIGISIVLLTVLISLFNNLKILNQRIAKAASENLTEDHYLSNDEYAAYQYIDNNIPKNSVFLCRLRVCGALPGFAYVKSYFGHINQTIDFAKKEKLADQFFSLSLPDDEAKKFLLSSGIEYVYFGPDERKLSGGKNIYSFLKKTYSNNLVGIYAVD